MINIGFYKRDYRTMIIKDIIHEFKSEIEKLYSKKLKHVILYGSWARNKSTVESDIDLLVILEGEILPGQEIDAMIDIITDINLKYDVLLSVYPVSEQDYIKINSPLLINVRKEGIAV